jgi:hypothetical protein
MNTSGTLRNDKYTTLAVFTHNTTVLANGVVATAAPTIRNRNSSLSDNY